ncbi:hypothetical protein [Ferrimonas sp. SCSIO 43195]|uniref:hypothetical protein n=1 Tax=Ferrimonas sp. SCSIO 43195 TaxID=2822844 RepID=UPI0020765A86|nr:hypothetical protein [Ferrimonas sp. SCSIO 43195]USD38428.1 hypothetical protein J8Z22_04610 [Ferrimonas sp. SCSIO 43195]
MFRTNALALALAGLSLGAQATGLPDGGDVDSGFYEDQAGFQQLAEGVEQGWGWSGPASKAGLYSLDSDTRDEPEPDPDPLPPSEPRKLYVAQTDSSDLVTLSWGASNSVGIGDGFSYKVYKQSKGYGRQLIATRSQAGSVSHNLGAASVQRLAAAEDTSTSTDTGTSDPGPNGDTPVRFIVEACNSAGCSRDQISPYYVVNPSVSGSTQTLPAVALSRQLLASASIAARQTRLKSANGTGYSGGELALARGMLGRGIDALKGEPIVSSNCWVAQGDARVNGYPLRINEQNFSFTQVDTYEKLQRSLGLEKSGGLGLKFGGFSFGSSGRKALYSETEKVTETSVIVARFTDHQNQFSAEPAQVMGMASHNVQQLVDGRKLEFRKGCGDRYIDSITTGRELLATIRIVNQSETYSETKTTTAGLKAKLSAYGADGNFDTSERTSINNEYKKYSFEVLVTQLGGSDSSNILRLKHPNALMDVLQRFSESDNNDLVVVKSTDREYPIPAPISGDSHYDVFANYPVYRDKLATWSRLDAQVRERCWMLDNQTVGDEPALMTADALGEQFYYNNQTQSGMCDAGKALVVMNSSYCAEQSEWGKCQLPNDSACIDGINGGQCMDRLEHITYKGPRYKSVRLDVSRGGCAIGPCKRSRSAQICFSNDTVIPDFSRNEVITDSYPTKPVAGMVVEVDRAWNVNYVRNSVGRNSAGHYCLNSDAQVYGKGGWGSGGRYESFNQMFGFESRLVGYSL